MIGERIKKKRLELKLNQAELADKIGVSSQTVFRWEKNKRQPESQFLKPLAIALGTTVGYLMGETNNPNPDVLKRVVSPTINETWREFYEQIISHNPELEFWFKREGMNLTERDYKMLSNLILSFIKSSQEGE